MIRKTFGEHLGKVYGTNMGNIWGTIREPYGKIIDHFFGEKLENRDFVLVRKNVNLRKIWAIKQEVKQ